MMQQPNRAIHTTEAAQEDGALRVHRRRSLYRTLASNIIRELRNAGYAGHELLPFASEVMQAITDFGWDGVAANPMTHAQHPGRRARLFLQSVDKAGRPVLTGERVILRPPARRDVPALRSWGNDPLVRSSLIPPVLRFVLEHLDSLADHAERLDLMICDVATQRAVGLVSLHDMDQTVPQAELGKMIGEPPSRGRGLADEATRLIVRYGFETLRLNRIFLRTLGANVRNIRLNERMGFHFEGVLRQAAMLDGKPTDVVLMAMLRGEYLDGHEQPAL